MSDSKQKQEIEQVVSRVMETAEKFDHVGKSEFETILQEVMQQVETNTGAEPERIVRATDKVIGDLPSEYGGLSEDERSWEAMIGYLYAKYLKELGLLK